MRCLSDTVREQNTNKREQNTNEARLKHEPPASKTRTVHRLWISFVKPEGRWTCGLRARYSPSNCRENIAQPHQPRVRLPGFRAQYSRCRSQLFGPLEEVPFELRYHPRGAGAGGSTSDRAFLRCRRRADHFQQTAVWPLARPSDLLLKHFKSIAKRAQKISRPRGILARCRL